MMALTEDQLKVKALLAETVTLLCKDGLKFTSELRIEGLIGITVDNNTILLVNINEAILTAKTRTPSSKVKAVRKSRAAVRKNSANCVNTSSGFLPNSSDVGKSSNIDNDNVCNLSAVEVSTISIPAGSSRQNLKGKRRRSSEQEQTLTLMVEDELFGDQSRGGVIKLESEQSGSEQKTDEHDDGNKFTDEYSDAVDVDDICSSWMGEPGVDASDNSPKLTEVSDWSTVEDDAMKSVEPTNEYLESYTCPVCGLIVRTSVTLRDHIAGKHGEQPRFVCSCCGKMFKWRSTFFYHRKSCQPTKR